MITFAVLIIVMVKDYVLCLLDDGVVLNYLDYIESHLYVGFDYPEFIGGQFSNRTASGWQQRKSRMI